MSKDKKATVIKTEIYNSEGKLKQTFEGVRLYIANEGSDLLRGNTEDGDIYYKLGLGEYAVAIKK